MKAAIEQRPPRRRTRLGWLAAAAAAVLVLVPVLQTISTERMPAASVLAEGVKTLSDIRSLRMSGRIRSPRGEPFEFVDLKAERVPLTMWKDFGDIERWRIEKPGRVVVMDGRESLLLMNERMASRGGPRAGFVEWLRPLLNPDSVLGDELAKVRLDGSAASVEESGTAILLSVRRKAAGNDPASWLRNKLIVDSDHTCRYRFDRETKRLTALTVTVHADGQDVEVLALDSIEYNGPIDPAVFALRMPENVTWYVGTSEMPMRGPLPTNARETAERFFNGFAQEDWATVLTVYPASEVSPQMRKAFGRLELVSLGEPFQVPVYGGWFVPYKIRFANGHTKSWKLAVRNDNPEGRWKVDGGY